MLLCECGGRRNVAQESDHRELTQFEHSNFGALRCLRAAHSRHRKNEGRHLEWSCAAHTATIVSGQLLRRVPSKLGRVGSPDRGFTPASASPAWHTGRRGAKSRGYRPSTLGCRRSDPSLRRLIRVHSPLSVHRSPPLQLRPSSRSSVHCARLRPLQYVLSADSCVPS